VFESVTTIMKRYLKQPLICFSFVLGMALGMLACLTVEIGTARAEVGSDTAVARKQVDRLFKTLGIIRLAGIAPPVEIALEDVKGQTVRMAEFKGKIVLLNFWATWCPECRDEMPSLENLSRRYTGREFAVVAVNLRESPRQVAAFLKKYNLSFIALLDNKGEIGLRFGIRSIPTSFILDKKGGVIGKALGSRQWDGPDAVALFDHLTAATVLP
jgi:thiol-disulfide isomerase/thioredoxin